MKIMHVFKKRLDYVFITDRRRVLMQQAIISSLVANLSQLLLSFLLVNNIVAKKRRAGGRSLIFLSVKILKWGALICRTELFLGP